MTAEVTAELSHGMVEKVKSYIAPEPNIVSTPFSVYQYALSPHLLTQIALTVTLEAGIVKVLFVTVMGRPAPVFAVTLNKDQPSSG